MADALTALQVEKAKPRLDAGGRKIRTEIPDGRQQGLYLVVQPSGKKSWAVRYRHAGTPKKLTLGPFPGIELAKARRLAGSAFVTLAEGHDPSIEKRKVQEQQQRAEQERKRGQHDLFENVAREFIERYAKPRAKKKNRPDAWKETARILGLKASPDDPDQLVEEGGDFVPHWRGRKIQSITKRDVIDRLETIADRAPIMANRSLAAVRKLFNWARGRDILVASPCAGVEPPSAEESRDRILTDDELKLVWRAAEAEDWPFGPIVQLLVLTGQREAEVAGMRWEEIDLDKKLWTLRPERVKNNERHEVPLSASAIAVISSMPKMGTKGFLFSRNGERPVTTFSRAKGRIDASVASARAPGATLDDWVFHDLRRTVASGMARLNVALPVIEKCLNHKSGSFRGIVGVYQRHSYAAEKRAALDVWASFVNSLIDPNARSNVIPLAAAS